MLQTWAQDLSYHPHVHYLAPGGGLASDGQHWLPTRKNFLAHVRPLGRLFRAKFRAELKKSELFGAVPPEVWQQAWVVHCQSVGSGLAALKYLAPYIFRVALSNSRLVKVAEDQVTFRYKEASSGKSRYCTVTAEAFIRRFLQHLLPKGFVKVHYYGLFSPSQRHRLKQLRQKLEHQAGSVSGESDTIILAPEPGAESALSPQRELPCPTCERPMRWVERLSPIKSCHPP